MNYSSFNAVGLSPVPMVVEAKDDHVVLFDKGAFFRPDGIALVHTFRLVQMVVKRGFVRNHQVESLICGVLQDVHRRHHGDGNSGNRECRDFQP